MKLSNQPAYWQRVHQVFVIGGIVASRFIVFVQQIIAARFIDKNEFGRASVSFSLISILLPFLSMSFAELSYRYAYSSQGVTSPYDKYGELLSRVIFVSLLMFTAVGMGLYLFGYDPVYSGYNLIYIYTNFWFVQVLAGYRVVERDFVFAFGLMRYSVFSVLILYVCLSAGFGYGAVPVSAVSAFLLALLFSDTREIFGHVYLLWLRKSTINLYALIKDVFMVSLTNMVSQAYLYIDVFIANHFFKSAEVADLRAPSLLVVVSSVFPVMFFSYFAPRIAASDNFKMVHEYYKLYLKIALPLCVIGFCVMFFWSKPLVLFIFGKGYASAELLMKWYSLIIVISILVRAPIGNILALRGYYKFNMMLSISFLMVMALLQYVMAKKFGVTGIPMATLIVAVTGGLVSSHYYLSRLKTAA